VRGSGPNGKITIADVRSVLAKARRTGTRILLRDGVTGGTFVRATPSGGRWALEYKPPGHRADGKRHSSRYVDLGDVRAVSPDDARRLAVQAKHAIMLGQDPVAERREAQALRTAPTWIQIRDEYLGSLRKRLRPSSYASETSNLRKLFEITDPRVPLREIGIREVTRLLDRLPTEGAVAHHYLSVLGRLLDWARSREIVDANSANPVRMLAKGARPRKPAPRQRVLSANELGQLWCAAEKLAPIERNLLRFLISTPLRRGEASRIEWQWIDHGGNSNSTITLPGKTTKTGENHSIPLGTLAKRVLDAIGGETWPKTGRVFKSNNARVVDWERFKARISKATDAVSKLDNWSFHDFRRSFVSLLAERGHSETVLDLMLAHRASSTRGGVLGVYQKSQRMPEQKRAMADWDLIVAGAINGDDDASASADVVPFTRNKAG
jgi:integrase